MNQNYTIKNDFIACFDHTIQLSFVILSKDGNQKEDVVTFYYLLPHK